MNIFLNNFIACGHLMDMSAERQIKKKKWNAKNKCTQHTVNLFHKNYTLFRVLICSLSLFINLVTMVTMMTADVTIMTCDDEKEEPCLRQPATPQPFCDAGDSYRWFVAPSDLILSVFIMLSFGSLSHILSFLKWWVKSAVNNVSVVYHQGLGPVVHVV